MFATSRKTQLFAISLVFGNREWAEKCHGLIEHLFTTVLMNSNFSISESGVQPVSRLSLENRRCLGNARSTMETSLRIALFPQSVFTSSSWEFGLKSQEFIRLVSPETHHKGAIFSSDTQWKRTLLKDTMANKIFDELLATVTAGGVMAILGIIVFLFPKMKMRNVTMLITSLLLAAGGSLAMFQATTYTWELTSVFTLPIVLLLSLSRSGVAGRLLLLFVKYRLGSVMLLLGGLCLAVAGITLYDSRSNLDMDQFTHTQEMIGLRPLSKRVTSVRAETDRGVEIPVNEAAEPRSSEEIQSDELQVLAMYQWNDTTIRLKPAKDGTNCHGWVFTGGRYSISAESVEQILLDNHYELQAHPEPGDVVIYRDSNNTLSHTAIVRYVTPGLPILVEGKWGWMGVYLHDVGRSCYGTNYEFYRSSRRGHAINDLEPVTVPESILK
jgi:hypothetical protein